MKKALLVMIALFTLVFAFIAYTVSRANLSDNVYPLEDCRSQKSMFDLNRHLISQNINLDSLYGSFPYKEYLDSANIWNLKSIRSDIRSLDSFSKNDIGQNREIISIALTTNLAPRFSPYLDRYNPDSLMKLLQWTERFQPCAADAADEILYQSVYTFWMDTISNRLAGFSREEPSRKYDFKFKYLRARCIEKKFVPDIKVTKGEKVINNLIYANNFSHFVNASWNQTSLLQKAVFFTVLLLTVYAYFCIYRFHSLKKKFKNE